MKGKILFLGAGDAQIQGILTAKSMGLEVIAMDGNFDAVGLKYADVAIPENFIDYKSVIKVAKKYEVDGIITICTEVGVVPAAKAATELGLVSIGEDVAEACTNKVIMRQKLRDGEVSVPFFLGADSLDKAKQFAQKIGFPLIIKPSIGSGSRGVRTIESLFELEDAFKFSLSFSRDNHVIIEEFMEGEEVSVECITYDGETIVLGVSDKIRTELPFRTDIKVIYPTNFDELTKQKIELEVIKAIDAVGLKYGPTHTELLVTDNDVKIVEIAARGGGFKLFDTILPEISGVDMLKESIKIALGERPNLKRTKSRAGMLHFFKKTPGRLISVNGIESAKLIEGVIDLDITIKPGQSIRPYTCGDDRIGYFIAIADSRIELDKIESEVEDTINFDIE